MGKLALAIVGAAMAFWPAAASAQDSSESVGALVAGLEAAGGEVGRSMAQSDSVLVYAKGVAKVAPGAVDASAYVVQLSITAPTAVEAARERDGAIDRMRAIAKTYGVQMAMSESAFSFGVPPGFARNPMMFAPPPPQPGAVGAKGEAPAPKPQFQATATLQFGRPTSEREPAFLDALHGAGADNISTNTSSNGLFGILGSQLLANAAAPEVSPEVWEAAMRDAMRAARSQAAVLADSAGRPLGDAREVLFLSRSVQRGAATVVVAVRYGFAAASR
jgi:hypothetical protein